MNSMDPLAKELKENEEMLVYLIKNLSNLPASLQLAFSLEYVKFSNAIRPLYVAALALRGNTCKKEIEKDD